MRFVHTSDLHLGKRLHEYSLIDDQSFILGQIADIVKREKADALMISGDIYDTGVPCIDAVNLFSDFVTELNNAGCPIYAIAGNHDSAERLSFARGILSDMKLYISAPFSGTMEKYTVKDAYGDLNIWMLPFIKPSMVRSRYPNEKIDTPDDAFGTVLSNSGVNGKERNVLLSHEFFIHGKTAPETGGSEDFIPAVGGADCISSDLLKDFDYVALGHIHRAQQVGRDTVRYSGSPLKYSESECYYGKSVAVVDVNEKGNVSVKIVPLIPERDLRTIQGTEAELMEAGKRSEEDPDDYVYIKLTEDAPDARRRLGTVYPNILAVEIMRPEDAGGDLPAVSMSDLKDIDPLSLFEDLFRTMNGKEMTEAQKKIFREAENYAKGVSE